eukprot:755175-Alexandrium_andersonii.AAC.1
MGYIMVTQRWRNVAREVESRVDAGFDSDHFPLVARLRAKLRAKREVQRARHSYGKCNEAQRGEYDEGLARGASE